MELGNGALYISFAEGQQTSHSVTKVNRIAIVPAIAIPGHKCKRTLGIELCVSKLTKMKGGGSRTGQMNEGLLLRLRADQLCEPLGSANYNGLPDRGFHFGSKRHLLYFFFVGHVGTT